MSMINDALRRASNASRAATEAPSVVAPPPIAQPPPLPSDEDFYPPPPPMHGIESSLPPALEPDEDSQPGTGKKHLLVVILLLLCIGGAAGFGIWKKNSAKAETVVALPAAKAIIPDAQVRRAGSNAMEAALANVAVRPVPPATPVAATPPPAVAVSVAPAAPSTIKFPALRLQSIFYRPSNPSVLINGKTLYVTDEIQGVLVADIKPASVTLVLSGQTNVLTLR